MPTYNYRCSACSAEFTHMKTIAERDNLSELVCPECGATDIKRVWPNGSSIGLAFKGSGFYITDYKNHKENGVSPSGTAPAPPSGS